MWSNRNKGGTAHVANTNPTHKMKLARAVGGFVGGLVRELGIRLALAALFYMVYHPASGIAMWLTGEQPPGSIAMRGMRKSRRKQRKGVSAECAEW